MIFVASFPRYMPEERPMKLTESEAGRRFLDALRKSGNKDTNVKVVTPTEQHDYQIAALGFGLQPTKLPNVTNPNELKRKRMRLRNTLEELLVEYLNSLSSEDSTHLERFRAKRSLTEPSNIDKLEQLEEIDLNSDSEFKISSDDSPHVAAKTDERNETLAAQMCGEQRQRITQLDRNELDAAIQRAAQNEHNIRRQLNHR